MRINYPYERKAIVLLVLAFLISIIFESIIVDKLSVFIIVISLIIIGKAQEKFLNPYYLFVPVPVSLLMYFNVSDTYMLDLTHNTYLLAIINMIAFILALLLTKNAKTTNYNLKMDSDGRAFLRLNIIALFILSLLGSVITPLNSVLWLFAVPAIVSSFKSKEKKMILLALGYILFVATIKLSKMQVLLYLLTILISMDKFYFTSAKQKIWLKLFSIFAILFLIFSFSFANKERGAYDADAGYDYYNSQGAHWEYDTSLFLPYMYLTTAWTNLQYVTESQDTRTNGLWLIKPFIGYLKIDEAFDLDSAYDIEPYSSFNTFTFVAVGFKDFGFWFSVIPTIVIGILAKRVYTRFLVSLSPFDIATFAIFALAIVEMFFSNHFYMQSYPFTMLIFRWGYKKVIKSL